MQIHENEVYTSEETQKLLKISASTFKRLIKKGIIRTAKIGGQYRILGKYLLELLTPEMQNTAIQSYSKVKAKLKEWE